MKPTSWNLLEASAAPQVRRGNPMTRANTFFCTLLLFLWAIPAQSGLGAKS